MARVKPKVTEQWPQEFTDALGAVATQLLLTLSALGPAHHPGLALAVAVTPGLRHIIQLPLS